MKLTDLEREEFNALANATYDPELWTEDDLPLLRATKEKWEKEQAQEGADVVPPPVDEDDQDDAPPAWQPPV